MANKKSKTPEKPGLLKIFERMGQNKSLNFEKSIDQAILPAKPAYQSSNHNVTPETPGGHLGTSEEYFKIDSNSSKSQNID